MLYAVVLFNSSKHGSAAAKMCTAVIALVSYRALGLCGSAGHLARRLRATRPWEGEVKAVENQWREVESTTESPAQLQSDGSDMEPIHTAATYGNADALGRELAKNVSPDLVCANGFVPLDYVVSGAIGRGSNNRVACIHLLIDAGADVAARRTGARCDFDLSGRVERTWPLGEPVQGSTST